MERKHFMTKEPPEEGTEPTANKPSTTMSRLEALAKAAEATAGAKQWRARQDGTLDLGEPSEVRSLTHDEEAKAQAEASMQRLVEKRGGSSKRRRW
jgi:hypothetical protein